jgi:hypothetical protein
LSNLSAHLDGLGGLGPGVGILILPRSRGRGNEFPNRQIVLAAEAGFVVQLASPPRRFGGFNPEGRIAGANKKGTPGTKGPLLEKGEVEFELYEFLFTYRLPKTAPMIPTPRRIKLEGSGTPVDLSTSRIAPPS